MTAERPTGDSQRATREQVTPLRHGEVVGELCGRLLSRVTVPLPVGFGGLGTFVLVDDVGDGGATVVVGDGFVVVVVLLVVVDVVDVVVDDVLDDELDEVVDGGGV